MVRRSVMYVYSIDLCVLRPKMLRLLRWGEDSEGCGSIEDTLFRLMPLSFNRCKLARTTPPPASKRLLSFSLSSSSLSLSTTTGFYLFRRNHHRADYEHLHTRRPGDAVPWLSSYTWCWCIRDLLEPLEIDTPDTPENWNSIIEPIIQLLRRVLLATKCAAHPLHVYVVPFGNGPVTPTAQGSNDTPLWHLT